MIVHFTASKTNIADNIKWLRRIVDTIHSEEHSIARDWIEPAHARQTKEGRRAIDWNRVFKHNMESVAKADVMIVETTYTSFGVGYQMATAVQQKKPILMLRRKGTENDSLAYGLDESVITFKEYDDATLEKTVKTFLIENDIQSKDMRFNFFIDRPIYNYLRWAAYKTGKTKAEILRDLITKEIDRTNDI